MGNTSMKILEGQHTKVVLNNGMELTALIQVHSRLIQVAIRKYTIYMLLHEGHQTILNQRAGGSQSRMGS